MEEIYFSSNKSFTYLFCVSQVYNTNGITEKTSLSWVLRETKGNKEIRLSSSA